MTEYILTKRQTCPVCHGERFVQHPAWEQYWADPANREQPTTPEHDIEWFKDRWLADYDQRTGRYFLPPEEVPCDKCGGQGCIEQPVDLRRALQELGVL